MTDTHCHLIDPQFRNDLNDVIERARIHPNETADESIQDMIYLERILKNAEIFAIGETGLPYKFFFGVEL